MSCEGSEGSEGPALLTALTLNWYFSPLTRSFLEKNLFGPSDCPTSFQLSPGFPLRISTV